MLSKKGQTKKHIICVLIISAILLTYTACGTSGKKDLQELVTDTADLSDTETTQIETTGKQEGEPMQEYDFSVFSFVCHEQ